MLANRSNKETVTLIWFEPRTALQSESTLTLRSLNDYLVVHNDLHQCLSFIRSIVHEKIFLILSGHSSSILLAQINDLPRVERVFLFGSERETSLHLLKKYPKIVDVFVSREELETSLRKHLHYTHKQVERLTFYDQHAKGSRNISEKMAEFLWFQLYHDVLVQLPSNSRAKHDMVEACRKYYHGNEKELQSIEQFEKNYSKDEAMRWYTRETFVYKLVNKALRTEDIEQLHLFRFFIGDLSVALAKEQGESTIDTASGTYAGIFQGGR